DPKAKFEPIIHILNTPFVLTAHPGVPYNNLTELAEYANKHPGKVNYSSAGVGSHSHVATELIASKLGIKLEHVPYSTSAPNLDVISGVIQMHFDPVVSAAPLIESGKVKGLAVSSAQRAEQLPNVPTLGETLPG